MYTFIPTEQFEKDVKYYVKKKGFRHIDCLWHFINTEILFLKRRYIMATSSITKNFIVSGERQVEMFADALEASANDRTPRVPINVTYLQGADAIVKFMEKRKKTDIINE